MSHDTFPQKSTEKTEKEKKNSGISRLSRDSEEPPLPEMPQTSGLIHPELRGKGDGLAGSNKSRQVKRLEGGSLRGMPHRRSGKLVPGEKTRRNSPTAGNGELNIISLKITY